jgi:PTS system beta-glucosides-specific IIC component
MLGAILLIPELMNNLVSDQVLYTLFQGSIFETDIHNTFFGIPILFPANGYQYSVIPIIFITFLGSKVEKFLKRVVPELLAHNLNAFLTILITFPLSILIIGPVTNVLSSLISAGVSGLYAISPVITSVVVGLLYQPLVIFGLHWPMSAIGINNLAQYGVDYIFPMSFTANFAQTAVVLAVYLKTRSKEQKALAIPAMVSGIFCIIEPAIYGFSLPVKKRFIFSMIGGAVGSFILAISATKMYAFAFGILGFVSFINPENGSLSGLYIAIFASIVTMIVSFCLTYFTFKEEEDVVDSTKKTLVKTEAIYSPVEGEVLPITMASDQSFALEMMGKGVVIKPKNGKITSPINGIIKTIFPGGHAIGIESPSGVEVLIHIGVDTVELKGEGFEILANVDDEVVVGQELVNVNLALLSELNVKDEVMVVITNTPEFLDVIPEEAVMIKKGKKIITVIPFSQSKETQLEVAHS